LSTDKAAKLALLPETMTFFQTAIYFLFKDYTIINI
jgi:hypothetical protein